MASVIEDKHQKRFKLGKTYCSIEKFSHKKYYLKMFTCLIIITDTVLKCISQIIILFVVQLKERMSCEKWAGSARFHTSATTINTEKVTRHNPHRYLPIITWSALPPPSTQRRSPGTTPTGTCQ